MARPRKADTHLPRCVYFRHGAYWYVKKGKWTNLGSNLHEALGRYAHIIEAPKDGISTYIDSVMNDVIRRKVDPNTYRQYLSSAKHLKKRLIEFTLRDVRPKHVVAIRNDLAATPNMANHVVSLLRQIYDCALEEELVDSNPCIGVKRLTEKHRDRYITDDEYQAIYEQADDRLQVIMDLLYLTAQRPIDVLSIRLSDLTDEGIQFEPKKTRRSTAAKLLVSWTPDLTATVERAKRLRGNVRTLTLLSGRGGKIPNQRGIQTQWTRACSKARVEDAQLRDLRAKSLTDAEAQGHNPTALAAHSSPMMTKRYLRRRQRATVTGPSKILDGPI